MGTMAAGQQDVFLERLRRIEQGGPNTASTVYAGPRAKPVRGRRLRLPRWFRALAEDLALAPFGFALGAIAMLSGRIAAFHLTQTPDAIPEEFLRAAVLVADVGIGALLLGLLGWSFGMTDGFRRQALIAGFALMMVGEGLLFGQAPGIFSALTSEAFVAERVGAETYLEPALRQVIALI